MKKIIDKIRSRFSKDYARVELDTELENGMDHLHFNLLLHAKTRYQ